MDASIAAAAPTAPNEEDVRCLAQEKTGCMHVSSSDRKCSRFRKANVES